MSHCNNDPTPNCLTYQDKPCLLSFECVNLDSSAISNRIIDYFANLEYHYVMPDYNTHDYLFHNGCELVRCYLFKPVDYKTDEITVCLIPCSENTFVHKIFSDLRNSFRSIDSSQQIPCMKEMSNMTVLDILFKYY